MKTQELHNFIQKYFDKKLSAHGATPKGVDWKDLDSQFLRFQKLSLSFAHEESIQINDIGCGYGAFVNYLTENFPNFSYHGWDISTKMIEHARKIHKGKSDVEFNLMKQDPTKRDYCIASGIFNLRMNISDKVWEDYIFNTLEIINKASIKGFAFNCLTKFSDKHKMRDDLYYTDPGEIFNYCKSKFSKKVNLVHDYELYEFTIIVTK